MQAHTAVLNWSRDASNPLVDVAETKAAKHPRRALVVHDALGGVVASNEAAQRLLGLRWDQATGVISCDPRSTAVSETGQQLFGARHAAVQALSTGDAVLGEVIGVPAATPHSQERWLGSTIWLEVSAYPLRSDSHDGETIGVLAVFEDISDTERGRVAASTLSTGYRLLAENATDLVFLVDLEGRISWASPSVSRFVGIDSADLVGSPSRSLVHPDDLEPVKAAQQRALNGEADVLMDLRLLSGDGEYRWVTAVTGPFLDERGAVVGRVTTIHDTHAQVRARQLLESSESRFAAMFRGHSMVMLLVDPDTGAIVDANPAASNFYGYTVRQLQSMHVADISASTPDEIDEMMQLVVDNGPGMRRFSHRTSTDAVRMVEAHSAPIESAGRTLLFTIIMDVTDREEREEQLRLAAAVFANTLEGVLITDAGGRVLQANPAFTTITGWATDQVTGMGHREFLVPPTISADVVQEARTGIRSGFGFRGEMLVRCSDGREAPALVSVSPIRDPDGRVTGHVGVIADISAAKSAQDELEYQASHDPVTGLPNRRWFARELEAHLHDMATQAPAGEVRARTDSAALLIVDVDRLKRINDSYGRHVGDELLEQVSGRLARSTLRGPIAGARLASFGADEFALLLPSVTGVGQVRAAVSSLQADLAAVYELSAGVQVQVSACVGLVMLAPDASAQSAVQDADAALHLAKRAGPGSVQVFSSELSSSARDRLLQEGWLREAVLTGRIDVHFQPQIDLRTGRVVGAEALARWTRPDGVVVPPSEFVPLAEECGVIVELGAHVLRSACAHGAAWIRAGLPPMRLAVNVSAHQLEREDFASQVARILAVTGFPAQSLELELTESALVATGSLAAERLEQLAAEGLRLAIDDFGTGYSSFAYLKHFPLAALKVDRAFVADLGTDQRDEAIVAAIISVGHFLSLDVLAEGVETRTQLDFLREQGCDMVQGFLASPPLDALAFERLLRQAAPLLAE